MAKLESLICSHCGGPISSDELKACPYCGEANYIKKEVNPLKISSEKAKQYIAFFQEKTAQNPKDTNALFAMGLFYLGLKNYELAQRNFKEAIDLTPMDADVYYYFALSLFAGRSPRVLDHQEAERINSYLQTAIQMHEKRKYLILEMVLKQGYFEAQGLKYSGNTPNSLFETIQTISPEVDEIDEIETHLNIADNQNQQWLSALKDGGDVVKDETAKQNHINLDAVVCPYCGESETMFIKGEKCICKNCLKWLPYTAEEFNNVANMHICMFPSERDFYFKSNEEDDVVELTDEDSRNDFFNYQYHPEMPEKIEKPWYPVINRIWKLALSILLCFVFLITEAIVGYTFSEVEVDSRPVSTRFDDMYKGQQLSRKKRREAVAEIVADSIAKAKTDSALMANKTIYYYKKEIDNKKTTTYFSSPSESEMQYIVEYGCMRTDWHLLLTVLFLLSPLITWIFVTISQFTSITKKRINIDRLNKKNQSDYQFALNKYSTRPTIRGFQKYAQHFLREHDALVPYGDPVGQVLKQQGIDESELIGKTLFINYFDYQNSDGNLSTYPTDVLDRVYYTVAILAKDCVMIFKNFWDTREGRLERCDYESVYYSNMNGLKRTDEEIIIDKANEVVIILPPDKMESIYCVSSNSRTSDPDEFFRALNRLVRSHKNS